MNKPLYTQIQLVQSNRETICKENMLNTPNSMHLPIIGTNIEIVARDDRTMLGVHRVQVSFWSMIETCSTDVESMSD